MRINPINKIGKNPVSRGGSWYSLNISCKCIRSSNRDVITADDRSSIFGLRVVLRKKLKNAN